MGKPGPKPKLDPVLVAADIAALNGNFAAVAKKHGVTRQGIMKLVARTRSLRAVVLDAREGMKDNAESALFRAVLAGEAWAVCFFLKTQAKDRGYVERQEFVDPTAGLGGDVRSRLDEVDGGGPGQPGEARGARAAGLEDAPAPAAHQPAPPAGGGG